MAIVSFIEQVHIHTVDQMLTFQHLKEDNIAPFASLPSPAWRSSDMAILLLGVCRCRLVNFAIQIFALFRGRLYETVSYIMHLLVCIRSR